MIFVDDKLFDPQSSLSEDGSTLSGLLKDPVLTSASDSLKATPERKFSLAEASGRETSAKNKWVYLFQREYATVDPKHVDFVGTDEATTCVGFAIRDKKDGRVSVAHMDSPNVVDKGLNQMLSTFDNHCLDDELEVHVIGAFNDSPCQHASDGPSPEMDANFDGYSLPLCYKIIKTLKNRSEKFHLRTFCVLGHNTRRDSENNACPIISGFAVETSTGSVIPAQFDNTSRCPDEIVRRIRVTASYEDPRWDGRLLDTYDTQTDKFIIAPCHWTEYQVNIAKFLSAKSDLYILNNCSTSPFAEAPDFVENERRKWKYLIDQPNWKGAFPKEQPRVWERAEDVSWTRSDTPKFNKRASLAKQLVLCARAI